MRMFNLVEDLTSEKILGSLIISHGFLDFFKFQRFDQFEMYLIIILLNFCILYVTPISGLLYFLYLSIRHFNSDIRFLLNKLDYVNYNLQHYGYGSSIFLGTIYGTENFNYYREKLEILSSGISSNIIIYTFVFLLKYQLLLSNFSFNNIDRMISVLIIYLGYLTGPYYFILYYLSFVHLPLALYQLFRNKNITEKKNMLLSFVCPASIMYYNWERCQNMEMGNTLLQIFYYLSISILNTHMIFTN